VKQLNIVLYSTKYYNSEEDQKSIQPSPCLSGNWMDQQEMQDA